ncbi:type II secretion system F family protein [Planctomicrobium sp. SH527]|uniref:type II secretion system F family protein n=1 Tax=Planctomicrobium sp. SH527 TaxID=3448123 RepID=UPI003F5C9E26
MVTLPVQLDPMTISIIAFLGVAGMIGAILLLFDNSSANSLEERLDVLAGKKTAANQEQLNVTRDVLHLNTKSGFAFIASKLMERFSDLRLIFVQADVSIRPDQFLGVMIGSGLAGVAIGLIANVPLPAYPLCAIAGAILPVCWLYFCRARRFKKFAKQLPGAMELIARALRSGHSIATAIKVVADELPEPISKEFNIAYEEQNLGITVEQSLKNLYTRMPNLDYKFFAMAVAIQRQSGGDLAEILDKIGHIIRERFRILGQVQALTGEGRISGIVLMILPIALFFAVWYLNAEYVMTLFTDEIGRQLVAWAIVLQILGAIAIKKIITIKV